MTKFKSSGILKIENGFLICPRCRRNKRLLRVTKGTKAEQIAVYCSTCKGEFLIDIEDGRASFSQSEARD